MSVTTLSESHLRVCGQLVQGLAEVRDQLLHLIGMKGENGVVTEGGIAGLGNTDAFLVQDLHDDATAGGNVPFAHEATLKLKFADGKLRGFSVSAAGPRLVPFFVGLTLPLDANETQLEGAGSVAQAA